MRPLIHWGCYNHCLSQKVLGTTFQWTSLKVSLLPKGKLQFWLWWITSLNLDTLWLLPTPTLLPILPIFSLERYFDSIACLEQLYRIGTPSSLVSSGRLSSSNKAPSFAGLRHTIPNLKVKPKSSIGHWNTISDVTL